MSKKKVLIVDNDSKIRVNLSKILSKKYEVVEADDGVKGYSSALKYLPDYIFVGFRLPYMDGVDLYERVRSELGQKTKVIFMTSWLNGLDDEIDSLKDCCFIEKPIKPTQIQNLLAVDYSL